MYYKYNNIFNISSMRKYFIVFLMLFTDYKG